MNKVCKFFGTFCYLGLIPIAPGTFGTLGAAILAIALWKMNLGGLTTWVSCLFIACALTVWSGNWAEKEYEKKDPQIIVMDEAAGFFLSILAFKPSYPTFICGFVLFRFFDILKPFPVKKFEALPGGWGILCDDLMAGVYAFIVTVIISYFWPACCIVPIFW